MRAGTFVDVSMEFLEECRTLRGRKNTCQMEEQSFAIEHPQAVSHGLFFSVLTVTQPTARICIIKTIDDTNSFQNEGQIILDRIDPWTQISQVTFRKNIKQRRISVNPTLQTQLRTRLTSGSVYRVKIPRRKRSPALLHAGQTLSQPLNRDLGAQFCSKCY